MIEVLHIDESAVEISRDKYNERYLAELHDEYKSKSEQYIVDLVPNDDATVESIIATIYHICRRLKDCPCIKGVAVPNRFLDEDGECFTKENSATMQLVKTLSAKHAQYCYYIKEEKIAEGVKNMIAPPFYCLASSD